MAINPEQYGSGLTPAKGDTKRMLLVKITLGGIGGGAGAGGVFAGNYSGVAPNFTPSSNAAIATDTSNQRQWNWYSNSWH